MEDNTKDTDPKGKGVRIINIKLSASDFIPPAVFKKDKANEVIKFGKKNLLPDFYINVFKNVSGKHQAIINRKVKMIAGNGFEEVTDKATQEFIDNTNGKKPLANIARLNAADYEVLNSYSLMVRWNDDKTAIGAIDYIPNHKVRKSTKKGVFKISNDWSQPKQKESNTREVQEFNTKPLPSNFAELKKEEKKFLLNQIVYFQEEQIGDDTYATPYYSASLNWILTDGSVGDFTINMVKKNFAGGYHIGFKNGIPEEEERQQERNNFVKEYGGDKGDSIIVTFSEPEDGDVQFDPLPSTGNEDIYKETELRAQENIFIAHEVTNPELFGIQASSGLGERDNVADLAMFQVVYIGPRQQSLLDWYNKLNKINGGKEEIKFKRYTLTDV